jgi:GDSL-like Lipase/Acylhydrolase family
MTVLRARAIDAQGNPVAGRTATLEPYQANRYRSGYDPTRVRGLPATSGADGWMQWTLPEPQRRPGPKGLAWVITGLEAQPVVARTQPGDGTVTLDSVRAGTVDTDSGQLVPTAATSSDLDSIAELAAAIGSTAGGGGGSPMDGLRSLWRDVAAAYRAPAVTPVFTLGAANAAPAITGSLVRPLTAQNTDDGLPYTYVGGYDLAFGTAGLDVNQIRPRLLTGSAVAFAPYSVRFGFAGATEFEIRTKIVGGIAYRLRIDDQWVTEGHVDLTGTNGSVYYLRVTGLDDGPHVYQLDVTGNFWFGGIHAANIASLWKVPDPAVRAVLLSDSLGGGASPGSWGISTWWERCCDLLGWGRWNASIGGTGMTIPGAAIAFGGRVAADVNTLRQFAAGSSHKPDVIVVDGSRNDGATAAPVMANVQAAAEAVYAAVQEANPDALIITGGAWQSTGSPLQAHQDANTGLRQAALAQGLPFVDYTTGQVLDAAGSVLVNGSKWITGTGRSSAKNGTGNADLYTMADGVHLEQDGQQYRALRNAEAFKAIINDLAAAAA